jgi:hypothetical protein
LLRPVKLPEPFGLFQIAANADIDHVSPLLSQGDVQDAARAAEPVP